MTAKSARCFRLRPCGDPYSRGWDVVEYADDFDDPHPVYRGDLSPSRGLRWTVALLRKYYPGCRIRLCR